MSRRRIAIADAGIRVLAAEGVRKLTHRAIDEELKLPPGSTSYYARTRRELLTLIAARLAERSIEELDLYQPTEALTIPKAAATLAAALENTGQRAADHRARMLLLLECHADSELRESLSPRPQVRAAAIETATTLLRNLGVAHPKVHAPNLVELLDGMLMQQVVRGAFEAREAIIVAYLTGLPRTVFN